MAKRVKLSDEIISEIRTLRSEGRSVREVAKQLNLSTGTVSKYQPEETSREGEEPPVVEFLDTEARFLSLLRAYSIKSPPPETVVSYVSSRGGTSAYSDLLTLKQCLTEQGLAPGKISPIVRHWASQEGLPILPAVETQLTSETQTSKPPDRWSIIGSEPVLDQNGAYSWIQILQLLEARHSQGNSDSPESRQLREEVVSLKAQLQTTLEEQRLNALRSEISGEISSLRNTISALSEQVSRGASGKTEVDLLSQAVEGGLGELRGVRGDIKSYIESRKPLPPQKSPEQREQQRSRLRGAVEADREIQALGEGLGFGPAKPAAPAPPPVIYE